MPFFSRHCCEDAGRREIPLSPVVGGQLLIKRSSICCIVTKTIKLGTGVDRVVFGVPPEAKDKVLPLLDKGAALMRAM